MEKKHFIILALAMLALSTLACQAIPLTSSATSRLENGRQALTEQKYDEAISELTAAIADYQLFLELNDDPYWEREAEKRLADLQSLP